MTMVRARGAGWPASLVSLGAGAVVASLWLHRAEPQSFEDFYSVYGGHLGIPDSVPQGAQIDPLPGWFFPLTALGKWCSRCSPGVSR
jgi:hypothetical protein